ncbi:alpha/beta fold hydrolase [Alicyclobacillus mengziensis]
MVLEAKDAVTEFRGLMNAGRVDETNALVTDDFFAVFSLGKLGNDCRAGLEIMQRVQGDELMWERAFIPTDRGTFEVFLRGEGKPLAITHLYSEFNETGDRFANTMVPHRRTFLVNLREAGESPKADNPADLDMDETVEDLEAIRKALGFQVWDFAGHSTGGMLGLMYAARHPESISSLIIVGAAASKDYASQPDCIYHPEHPMFERMQELRGLQLQQDISVEQKRAYGQETTKLSLFKPENYPQYFSGNIRKSVAPVRLDHFSRHDFPKFDLTGELPNVRTRTLVMCGRQDVQCPIRCSEEIRDLMPNVEMMVFEASNHYPFLEESGKFADTVKIFLEP